MRDRRWIALCAIGLVVLAMLNLPDAASRRVKGAVRDGISPLQAGLRGGVRETRDVVRYVRGLGDLALENRALTEEIVYLRGEMRMAEELARDNRLLRDQLGFMRRFPNKLISCEVIGRDSTGWWQTVRLDKGAAAGVAEGRAVLTTEGLIGRTTAVSDRTADVLLLSGRRSALGNLSYWCPPTWPAAARRCSSAPRYCPRRRRRERRGRW